MEVADMQQEDKREAEERTESSADGGKDSSAEGEPRKTGSQRVEQLSRFLRHQQEVVYRQQNISKYFTPPLQKVATKCWEQIHPNISSAIEGKYSRVLEEWSVSSKLEDLDRLQQESPKTVPAWRPTGIPQEDSLTAELVQASHKLPDFQSRLTQAQVKSRELQQALEEKEEELARLDQDIATSIASLKHVSSSFPLPASSVDD